MYQRVRKKMTILIISAILILAHPLNTASVALETTTSPTLSEDQGFDNNIIDFDEEYTVKFNKKYGTVPWPANDFNKNTHKYTVVKDSDNKNKTYVSYNPNNTRGNNNTNVRYNPHNVIVSKRIRDEATTEDIKVVPLELVSTTENVLTSIIERTTEQDLTVIPLSTTNKLPSIKFDQAVTLPATTEIDVATDVSETDTIKFDQTTLANESREEITTEWEPLYVTTNYNLKNNGNDSEQSNITSTTEALVENVTESTTTRTISSIESNTKKTELAHNATLRVNNTNSTNFITDRNITIYDSTEDDADIPVFTELDTEDFEDIPEDYYDTKDILPTSTPKTDAISVLFGLAGSVVESVVESVAEKVVPKSIFDLFKRMQKQNEALEAERLRSREENGGIGQFGRGILKSLSTGLGKPLSQLMAGAKEAGSLDTDRGFVGNVASSVTSVANAANTYLEAFKDKVQAIYPGTVWCGDGHSAQARSSSDLGLFFFTDTCCRQHDACKIYIRAGETKYGLTNTGLFTRSHCSCDTKFRECLRRTSSLVSAQIGLTYFNVLGPQCFRRAHPIVKCNRRTRITGQKCEEYELDNTKPRMWQWFDNETF